LRFVLFVYLGLHPRLSHHGALPLSDGRQWRMTNSVPDEDLSHDGRLLLFDWLRCAAR
jgi:hypothetical protein